MEIKTYNKDGLAGLINSSEFSEMPVIPISTIRAMSHIYNPRADADDILLIIAYENDKMCGYLGVLPDRIYNEKGKGFKCGWLSCIWIDPELRGKGIAKQLLATAFRRWDNRILATEFTAVAKSLYDRTGEFDDLTINEGLRCYRRFNLHEILPAKSDKYKPYQGLLKIADGIANIPVDIRHKLQHTTSSHSDLKCEEVEHVEESIHTFINGQLSCQIERRGRNELNWIIQYPWIKQSAPTQESKRYHFSSVSARFENLCYKLTANDKVMGYLHFTIRDHHLKLPYAYFEDSYLPEVVRIIIKIMQDNGLNMFTIFDKRITSYLQSHPSSFIYQRNIKRHYLISKALSAEFQKTSGLTFQDGDADCAFT